MDLTRGGITRPMLLFAGPMIAGNLLQQCYNIADTLIVGRALGASALASVGFSFTLMTFLTSVLLGLCMGSGALWSMLYGAEREEELKRCLFASFVFIGSVAVLLNVGVLALLEPVMTLLRIPAGAWDETRAYLRVVLLGVCFTFLYNYFACLLRSVGNSVAPLAFLAVSTVLNIGLDLWFVLGLGWGVAGAAWATVLSQAASCVFVLAMLRHRSMPIRLEPDKLSPALMGKVLLFGLTPFLTISLDSVILIVLNAVLQSRGGPGTGDTLVSCNTIVQSYMLLITMPMGGITGGCQPIVSYNYGAGNTARIRKAIRYVLLLCLAFTAGMTVITFTLSPLFVRLFTSDQALVPLTVKYIRRFCLCAVPLAAQYTAVDMSTALGRVRHSLFCSVNRKVWFTALTLALPALLGAADAAFWAEPIVDLGCAAITSCLVFTTLPDFLRRRELEQTLS